MKCEQVMIIQNLIAFQLSDLFLCLCQEGG